MADRKLFVEVVSPEEVLWASEADMVVAVTPLGEVGILPLHTPLVTTVVMGEVRVKHGDHVDYFVVDGGFLEVKEDRAMILASSATPVSRIEIEAERRAKAEMEKAIAEAKERGEDIEELKRALERAIVRLRVAEKAQKS